MRKFALTVGLAGVLAMSAGLAQAADSYVVEPNHTYPSFRAPHMGISWWAGKFKKTSGSMTVDRAAKSGKFDITVDATTVDFGHEKLNKHAMSPDFIDAARYPDINYKGKIMFTGDSPSSVEGNMTFHGVTNPLTLKIHSFKCIMHPFIKKEVCGADVSGEFNRGDYGVGKYGKGAAGVVQLTIQVEAVKQ